MSISRTMASLFCAGAMMVAGVSAAYPQAGLAQNAEITTSEAAQKLLQPVDLSPNKGLTDELRKNGIDTSAIDPNPPTTVAAAWPGTIFNAEGGPLKIFNCTGGSIKVQTYNSNDAVTLIAYQEKSIGNGSASGLKCATKSCKIRIGSGNVYSALSGPQVLLSGKKLQATNTAAVNQGCGAYVKR